MIEDQMFLGPVEPIEDRFVTVSNRDPHMPAPEKPQNGLWTSTVEQGSSAWLDWCKRNDWGITDETKVWILEPYSDVELLTIDSLNDLKTVLDLHGRDDQNIPGTACIDFEELHEETRYDGIHLTKLGRNRTRLSFPGLYSWDTESTVWFEWMFKNVECAFGVSP